MFNDTDDGQTQYCQFQNECIEYKDISYLKIMPICAIHELSIACHDKVNKCKYYKLYKELQRLKAENKRLKAPSMIIPQVGKLGVPIEQYCKLKQVLEEVRELANKRNVGCGEFCEVNRKEHNCNAECNAYYLKQIQDKIDEVLKDD